MRNNKRFYWFLATHQMWKVVVAFLGLFVGFLNAVIMFKYAGTLSNSSPVLLMGISFALIAPLWFIYFGLFLIKCPNCKRRVLWYLVNNKKAFQVVEIILTLDSCPICNDNPLINKNENTH